MSTPRGARSFTVARIVALLLIALLVSSLAFLRSKGEDRAASVPDGAKAGDLTMEPCRYTTEAGDLAADCGTLVVPENRRASDSRLIALPVVRIRAASKTPGEPVFPMWGGPGLTNMGWSFANRFAEDRDVVMVGYRGIDGSSVLDCPEVGLALKRSAGGLLEGTTLDAYADGFRACAKRLQEDGVDVTSYGLVQQVEDMEAARTALGYDKINLLSESAGTRTALIYAWRYPESIRRSVMVGANPPGHYFWDEATFDEQLKRYAGLCAQDTDCSARTDDLIRTFDDVAAEIPDRWGPLPIKKGNVLVTSLFGLMESNPEVGVLTGPATIDSWLSLAEDDPSAFWFVSLFTDIAYPDSLVWGQYASAGRPDAQAVSEHFAKEGRNPDSPAEAATAFVWGGGRLAEVWPAAPDENEYSTVRDSDVETLLVGGTLDFAIPPQVATKELLPHLSNGKQVLIENIGHTGDFWTYQPEASSRLVNSYLATGEVDDSLYRTPKLDFAPRPSHALLGKGMAAGMVGLSLLTILSLLLMAVRVRRRGGFGRLPSVLLRSLYPVLLGLGGWFAAVLFVMTVLPGFPIDNRVLTIMSVAVPIGLGIYWAWVPRGQNSGKGPGFWVGVLGSLVGAWFGATSAPSLLAVFTAIGGAIAVANLALIIFDIRNAATAREPSGPEPPTIRLDHPEPVSFNN